MSAIAATSSGAILPNRRGWLGALSDRFWRQPKLFVFLLLLPALLWLGIVYAITLICSPALSLPCGFTKSGLPVGLQVVAPPRGEAQLLAGTKVLEDILGVRGTTPIDPRAK